MEQIIIDIKTYIKAPVDKVWEYYNTPEHITKWNFASDDWTCPKAMLDLRAGGKQLIRMEAKDGSMGFDFEAIYDDVVPNQKIQYKIADGRKVVVFFEGQIDGTEVSITFEAEDTHSKEMQEEGWQAILDNFKKYTETH